MQLDIGSEMSHIKEAMEVSYNDLECQLRCLQVS